MPSLYANTGAKRAREAREELGCVAGGPAWDLIEVVEKRGGADVVVLSLPEGVAGAYIPTVARPLVFVNGAQAVSRQRFTVAHEFGHHRLGHGSVVDDQAAISGYRHDANEVMANAFAAEFLLPRQGLTGWARANVEGPVTLEHVVRLGCEYGVSAQAARYALETARVLTDPRRCEQLDAEIEEGLHRELFRQLGLEPMEDELADAATRLPRIPSLLRASALGELLAGDIDAAGLAQRLGRSSEEVEAMLAELGLDRVLPV